MSPPVVATLQRHSRELVDVLQSETADELLPTLVLRRRDDLEALGAALAAGETLTPEVTAELEQLDREVTDAMARRRDQVSRQLVALRRGRSAGSAYRPEGQSVARFMDRAG